MKNKKTIKWLSDLIETSEMCLPQHIKNTKPSTEYDKLMFQLKSKLKELQED